MDARKAMPNSGSAATHFTRSHHATDEACNLLLWPDGLVSPHSRRVMRSLSHGYGESARRTRSRLHDAAQSLCRAEAHEFLVPLV
jgi:hypothetical protein